MKTINFQGKKIAITKDNTLIFTGIMLVVLSGILLGAFAWATFIIDGNFDSQFWLNYSITMSAVLLGFFGMLITRLVNERKKANYVIIKQKLKNFRASVVKNKQIGQMKYWLKWVYNYTKRVDRLQEYLIRMQEKIKVYKVPEDDLKEINAKKYNKAKKLYDNYIEKKDNIEKHLQVVELHYNIINAYKRNNTEDLKQFLAKLKNEIDLLPKVIRKIKNVTYAKLFNGAFKGKEDEVIDINYFNLIFKMILPKLLIGAGFTLLLTSIIPQFNGISPEAILMLIVKLSTLVGYLMFALTTATNIADTEKQADENRLTICDAFKEDLEIYNGIKWQEVDEREEETKNIYQEEINAELVNGDSN